MTQKETFLAYLKEKFPDRFEELSNSFQIYFEWLSDINQHINLISRKTPIEDYWTIHFLDTLLITEVARFSDEMILISVPVEDYPEYHLLFSTRTLNFTSLMRERKNWK